MDNPISDRPLSKDTLLRQADGLRDLARRARKLAETALGEPEGRRLTRYVQELTEDATRLEKQAIDAKTIVFKT